MLPLLAVNNRKKMYDAMTILLFLFLFSSYSSRFGSVRFVLFYLFLSLSFSVCVTFVLSVILWLRDDCCCGYWCCCVTLRMCVDVVSNQINLQPLYGRHINGLDEPVRLQAMIVLISKHLNTLHTILQIHNSDTISFATNENQLSVCFI